MEQLEDPIAIEGLKPYPLARTLENLPPNLLEEFTQLYELVRGYTKSLQAYEKFEKHLVAIVEKQISTVNDIIVILQEYNGTSQAITGQIHTMEELYKEFINLETYQYQLLSSNFNQSFLKLKFSKLTSASDVASMELVHDHKKNPGDLSTFLQDFKNKRKLYHLRQEKLNRWNEERISGFF